MRAAKEFFMRGTTGEERFTNMMESLTNEDQKRLIFTLNWICNNNFSGFSTLNISHYRIISIEKWGDNISISQKGCDNKLHMSLQSIKTFIRNLYLFTTTDFTECVKRDIYAEKMISVLNIEVNKS